MPHIAEMRLHAKRGYQLGFWEAEDDGQEDQPSTAEWRWLNTKWRPTVRFERARQRLGLSEFDMIVWLMDRAERGLDAGEWAPVTDAQGMLAFGAGEEG